MEMPFVYFKRNHDDDALTDNAPKEKTHPRIRQKKLNNKNAKNINLISCCHHNFCGGPFLVQQHNILCYLNPC